MSPSGLQTVQDIIVWTLTIREKHSRPEARQVTDLTDAELQLIETRLPAACKTSRPHLQSMREAGNAIFYMLRGVVAWHLRLSGFLPWPTGDRWFAAFHDSTVF